MDAGRECPAKTETVKGCGIQAAKAFGKKTTALSVDMYQNPLRAFEQL
jgi:hypothetical protein